MPTANTVRAAPGGGGVCVLTLDRPPANAIDESLLSDLLAALDGAGRDDAVRTIVLTGAGRFFSAGFDLTAPPRDAAATARLASLLRCASRLAGVSEAERRDGERPCDRRR